MLKNNKFTFAVFKFLYYLFYNYINLIYTKNSSLFSNARLNYKAKKYYSIPSLPKI